MAHSILPHTHERGFRQPADDPHWLIAEEASEISDRHDYEIPPSVEVVTSTRHNDLGFNVLRVWPTLHDGTASPHGVPEWWNPPSKVDVLICGAGPSGLEVALSCLRQGLTFRIIDKNSGPLIAGRADGVQPRFLETLGTWGLATEVHEEGPLIERTAIYHNGQLLHHGRSHQSDSRYRGLHIITQGQIERIFVRDLLRHKVLVERNTTLKEYSVTNEDAAMNTPDTYPIKCSIDTSGGKIEHIEAKYLIGSDGASSAIRQKMGVPFDGISTDIYWGIMDCVFETDYPHAWIFGSVVSTEHGGCVIIPRENGYIRLYTQLNGAQSSPLMAPDPQSGGQIHAHSITPEQVLEQANRIFSPYKLKFAAPLSWFAVWKISERVARSFSSEDLRVHIVGDAAHVHSVMGAFGLNASILDAANIGWKLGLCVKGKADPTKLLPTYNRERRLHAANIIEISGKYLRFICSSKIQTARLHYLGADLGLDEIDKDKLPGTNGINGYHKTTNGIDKHYPDPKGAFSIECDTKSSQAESTAALNRDEAKAFLYDFFGKHGHFLLGVDAEYGKSCLNPSNRVKQENGFNGQRRSPAIRVANGVRAPNPRICLDNGNTGYLYDKLIGDGRFHLVVFGSNLMGTVRSSLKVFSDELASAGSQSKFYTRFGGANMFNIVLVGIGMPFEVQGLLGMDSNLEALRTKAIVLADDRAPDESAHTIWGVNYHTGGVAVVRPDLWVGTSVAPDETNQLASYFKEFLIPSGLGLT